MPSLKPKAFPVFYRFAATYLALLAVPLTACLYIYTSAARIIQDNVYQSHMSALRQSIETIDKELENLDDITNILQVNLAVNDYIQSESPFDDPDKLANFTRVQSHLTPFLAVNNFLDKLMIYSERSRSLISDRFISIRLDRLYPNAITVNDLDLDQFITTFLTTEYKGDLLYGVIVREVTGAGSYLVYAKSMTNAVDYQANVFAFVNERKIMDLLRRSLLANTEGASIFFRTSGGYVAGGNENQTVFRDRIFARMDEGDGYLVDEHQGVTLFVMYAHSARTGSLYSCAIPMGRITTEVARTRNVLILLVVAAAIISLVGAVFLAYRQSNPVRAIIDRISGVAGVREVTYSYDFINQQLSDILNSNRSLQEEMRALLPMQRNSILHSLINGEYRGAEEIARNLQAIGVRTDARHYGLLIILTNETSAGSSVQELAASKFLIRKAVQDHMLPTIGVLDIDFERQVVLVESDIEETAALKLRLEESVYGVKSALARDTEVMVSCAGSISHRVDRFADLYREAKEALDYVEHSGDSPILWYRGALDAGSGSPRYTIETELELIRAVSTGDAQRCREILDTLGHPTDRAAVSRLMNGLITTLGRLPEALPDVAGEIGAKESDLTRRVQLAGSSDLDLRSLFAEVKVYLGALCEQARKLARRRSNPLIQKITAYLQGNFADPQLSLTSVAQQFGITDIYLSRLFKEQTGVNYSKHLETLRMSKASELLGQHLKIAEVALKTGYHSVQTFRRVYKQHFGHTPSERLRA